LRGIGHLQKHSLPVSVRVTLHRKNVDDLEAVARLLLEDLQLPVFSTNAASFFGLCRANTRKVQLTTAERTRAMRVLWKLNDTYGGRISADAGPLADAARWLQMESNRSRGKDPGPGGGYLSGCGGVGQTLAVRADGMMVPCIQLSHIRLGRINVDPLERVWQTHPELRKLRERSRVPLDKYPACSGCDYVRYCTGNCPALAYNLTGHVNHPSPDACLMQFLADGGQLPCSPDHQSL
jgi:SynChlorMet cassette radical SAM/SPASM protein ScmE